MERNVLFTEKLQAKSLLKASEMKNLRGGGGYGVQNSEGTVICARSKDEAVALSTVTGGKLCSDGCKGEC